MNQHILLSTGDPGLGGVDQYNHSLLCALAKLGYRVTSLQPEAVDHRVVTKEQELGIRHVWMTKNIIAELQGLFTQAEHKPDLIICSNTGVLANFNITKLALGFGIPYIVIEGLVEPDLAQRYPEYLNELSRQYNLAHSVIAVCQDNLNLLHQVFGLPEDQGQVIHYGRPAEYFTGRDVARGQQLRESWGIPDDGVVCLTAAGIQTRKGYIYQLEAIKQLMFSPVWSKLYFVWAGTTWEPELEKQIRETREELGISNRVILLGHRTDVVELLNAGDIFVFPSLLEGMPLCVMEAMAKGLPVVATAVSGIPEELGETGKLVPDPKINPQGTVRELVATITEWAENPQLRRSIGEACRARAEEMFQEHRMIEETLEVIQGALLTNHGGKSHIGNYIGKIIIDGVFFQLNNTGIARVWRSLLEEWANTEFADHILVLDRANTAPKVSGIRYLTIPAYDYNNTAADKQMLQQVCNQEQADLFISSYYTTPITTPSVFMAYDMIPEVMGADLDRPMWREKHYAIEHASAYIAISHSTARDLVKYFPQIALESVAVAHCGVSRSFTPGTVELRAFKYKYGIGKPYFLLVGADAYSYKNGILFLKAFSQLANSEGFDLIMTGFGGVFPPELREYTSGSAVHLLRLSDEELAIAYSGAVCLVFPSKYEGFGMPILEAMACGCPVITCPNASLPEVGGTAVIYVNDDDIDGMANALCELQKPSVRQSLISGGLAQSQKFSWGQMGRVVSWSLINASLLGLKLRDINLIIFPDPEQSEQCIYEELVRVITGLENHPDCGKMTLLVNASKFPPHLTRAFTEQLCEEEEEGLQISVVGKLSRMQWEALLPRLTGRIVLAHEDGESLGQLQVKNISYYQLDEIESICVVLA
ncbi:glycosyltransferase [Anabaena sp. CS-542/02]|uniref:glycosyltransferase n=1 Tax=Anabaena sp. CS-542/02 TaxID=3021719 RepID=UPI002FEE40A5